MDFTVSEGYLREKENINIYFSCCKRQTKSDKQKSSVSQMTGVPLQSKYLQHLYSTSIILHEVSLLKLFSICNILLVNWIKTKINVCIK